MPRTICNGVSCYWEEQGSGPPVVLAHPLFCDAEYWDAVARDLSRDHRVIRIDFRCHGRSVGNTHPWPIREIADDLATLIDAAGEKAAVVVGAGMGGLGALRLAIRDPARLTGLVLMGTDAGAATPIEKPFWKLVHVLATRFEPDQRPAVVPRAALLNPVLERLMFSKKTRATDRALVDKWLEVFAAQDPTSTPFAIQAVADRDSVAADLSKVRTPTLILDGAGDRCNPPHRGARLHKGIAGSRREVIPDAGHMMALEQPAEVTRHLRSFLSQLVRAAA